MKSFAATTLAAAALAVASLSQVDAHSYMIVPTPRDLEYHVDAEAKLGCPRPHIGQVTEYKAGETIDVRHYRNNHIGGFIRYAIAPRGQETKENFDKNAFYYTCRESGPECVPRYNPTDMFVTDGADINTIRCGDKIKLPDWLPAGDYVLQWTWFGVGLSNGQKGSAEPQFRSCADIKLTTSGSKSGPPSCPGFTGGDRMTKVQNKGNDVCLFYHANDIVTTGAYIGPDEGAESKYVFGKPAPVEHCTGESGADYEIPTANNATAPANDDDSDSVEEAKPTEAAAPAVTPVLTEAPKPAETQAPQPAPQPAQTTEAPAKKTPTKCHA